AYTTRYYLLCLECFSSPLRTFSFFFYCYAAPRDLHSFPTRRSSDLAQPLARLDAAQAQRPISDDARAEQRRYFIVGKGFGDWIGDRKSTRLNSSHRTISYAVFCLKKKKK